MPTRYNRGFYCRSYCLLNMFRAPLCLSSGAQEYYTVVAACGISCCGFQVAVLVWSWGLCVRFAGRCSILQTGHNTLRLDNTNDVEQRYVRHNYFIVLYHRLHVSTYIQVIFRPSFTGKSIKCYGIPTCIEFYGLNCKRGSKDDLYIGRNM